MLFKLTEVFYSLQGEGYWTGTPAIFIRFAGCNLQCDFCDTLHAMQLKYSINQLLTNIQQYPCNRIILTGGEPTLQLTQDFIDTLKRENYTLHIESNGTQTINLLGLDWVTVSPKLPNQWQQRQGDELKVVYTGQSLDDYHGDFQHYFLQPCNCANITETIAIVQQKPPWRLSLQTHKLIGIR